MRHRHLDYPAATAAGDLPSAAIVDILDRGDLEDWLPLISAVASDPDGAVAQRMSDLIDAFPMYGTSPLWRAWLERRRLRLGARKSVELGELRRRRGVTQAELAARLGIAQSDVSKIERRTDLKLSTLRAYLAALGCPLRLGTSVGGVEIGLDATRPGNLSP